MRVKVQAEGQTRWLNTFCVEEVWRDQLGRIRVRTMAGEERELENNNYDLVEIISSEWDLGLV